MPTSVWRKKLGVGFVLVLLLTALVAAIGVWSLQTISQRFDGLKQMSSLNSGLLKVRLLEQEYALHGNPKNRGRLARRGGRSDRSGDPAQGPVSGQRAGHE